MWRTLGANPDCDLHSRNRTIPKLIAYALCRLLTSLRTSIRLPVRPYDLLESEDSCLPEYNNRYQQTVCMSHNEWVWLHTPFGISTHYQVLVIVYTRVFYSIWFGCRPRGPYCSYDLHQAIPYEMCAKRYVGADTCHTINFIFSMYLLFLLLIFVMVPFYEVMVNFRDIYSDLGASTTSCRSLSGLWQCEPQYVCPLLATPDVCGTSYHVSYCEPLV